MPNILDVRLLDFIKVMEIDQVSPLLKKKKRMNNADIFIYYIISIIHYKRKVKLVCFIIFIRHFRYKFNLFLTFVTNHPLNY